MGRFATIFTYVTFYKGIVIKDVRSSVKPSNFSLLGVINGPHVVRVWDYARKVFQSGNIGSS